MLGGLLLAAYLSVPRATRDAEFDKPPHNTLKYCSTEVLAWGDCKMPPALTAADIEQRLAGKDTAWWRDGDQFVVVARRDTDQAYLCCSARGRMDHVGGDLWALRLRVKDLDDATIDVLVEPEGSTVGAYRGPNALPRPELATDLKGQIVEGDLISHYLDDKRHLRIYLPPGHDPSRKYPVVYMADGIFRQNDAGTIEPLILRGELPPLILVEIWPGMDARDPELRSEEYLKGWNGGTSNYLKHGSFLLNEVVPYVEQKFGASSDPAQRVITGYSSGAAWAVSMGVEHPDMFGTVVAQSIGWNMADRGLDHAGSTRFFLSAGTLEPAFYTETLKVADAARASGHAVVLRTCTCGHSDTIWRALLVEALKWALGGKAAEGTKS